MLPLFFLHPGTERSFLRACSLPDRILKQVNNHEPLPQPDAELDLRGVICPYNFVKTKLKLETMEKGQLLSVLLDAGDPIRNVPQSVRNEGHTVLSQEPVDQAYRVVIRRREDD
jgi:tRNA 2-thiouridine synthesizing protein A